jgi:hypothetical protein
VRQVPFRVGFHHANQAFTFFGERRLILLQSGHYIQLEQPDLIIHAIEQVLIAIQDERSRLETLIPHNNTLHGV